MAQLLYPWGMSPQYPLDSLTGPQSQSECGGKVKKECYGNKVNLPLTIKPLSQNE